MAYDGTACSKMGAFVGFVSFEYRMHGATMGELRVTNDAGETIWSRSRDDQGNSWNAVTVDV